MPRRTPHPFLLTSAVLASLPALHARADRYWVNTIFVGNANWSTAANWSATSTGSGGAGAPGPSDIAVVNFTSNFQSRTANPNLDVNASIFALDVGSASGGGPAVNQDANVTLSTTSDELIGYQANGAGAYSQSAGSNSVGGSLYVGFAGNARGFYTLTGGALSVPAVGSSFYVGYNGAGTFNQSGGTVTTHQLTLADQAGSAGSYTLSAGSLSVSGTELVARSGTATFLHTGGANSVPTLQLGSAATSNGVYTLSGASLSTTNTTVDRGTFSNTDGSHTATLLIVGRFNGDAATYSLAGTGFLSAGSIEVGGDESPTAGVSAGTFVQTGGSVSTPVLYLAEPIAVGSVATGSYSLSGTGSLAASIEYIGVNFSGGAASPKASFVQTGGTNSTPTLFLGSASGSTASPNAVASYALSGGSLAVSGTLSVGDTRVNGTFNQSGGSASAGSLTIAPGSSYTLSAGTLSTSSIAGTNFTYTGGSLTLTDPAGISVGDPTGPFNSVTLNPTSLLSAPSVTLANASILTFNGGSLATNSLNLNSGTLAATGNNSVSSPSQLTAPGTIAGTGNFTNTGSVSIPTGTLTLATTNSNSSSGLITLSPGAQLSLTGALLTNSGVIQLSPGSRVNGPSSLFNVTGGVVEGSGTLAAPLTNIGGATLLVQTGTLTLQQPTTNYGTISLAGPAATLAGAAITNSGTLTGDGTVTNPLANASNGQIRANLGQTLILNGLYSNAGTLSLQGGTLQSPNPLTNNGSITGRGTLRLTSGSLTNNATILLTGGPTDVFAPLTSNSGSKITVAGGAAATFYSPVTMNTGSQFVVAAGSLATFLAPVTGLGQFTGTGTKDFESGASAPAFLATGGDTAVQSAASLSTAYLRESSLSADGPVSLTPNSPTTVLHSLTITPTGSLDLANNLLVLDLPTPTDVPPALSQTRANLAAHRLFSSTADADPQHHLSLAYADNALLNAATWGDVSTDSTSILFKLTPTGDANLDGAVDADDYALLDRSLAVSRTDASWTDGDFNYDGIINNQDYLLIDTTLGQQQGGRLSPAFLAQRASEFGADYVSTLLAAVPEPLALSSLLYPLSSLLLKRRPRTKFHP